MTKLLKYKLKTDDGIRNVSVVLRSNVSNIEVTYLIVISKIDSNDIEYSTTADLNYLQEFLLSVWSELNLLRYSYVELMCKILENSEEFEMEMRK